MDSINQEGRDRESVDTGGGAYVRGDVRVEGGDFVGRDQIIQNIDVVVERALSAVEGARQRREFEAQLLADGIGVFARRLQSLARETDRVETGSPYKGLLEYRLSDTELFFGRDRAIDRFLQCLQRGPLTVLHAESGAGKTSLLQAGIAPRLIAQGHLPVYLRPIDVSPVLAFKRTFLTGSGDTPGLEAASMRDFSHRVSDVLGSQTELYVFFDQFEEFFTHLDGPAQTAFVAELAGCLDDGSLDAHWILSLRSEFFSDLANFRSHIRNPFENDYRLNRLTRAEAHEVVVRPAALRGIRFEAELVDTLLDYLGGDAVAPPQVQLVCQALYEGLQPGETVISQALYEAVGGVGGILRNHLDRVLTRDLPADQRPPARWLLEALITSDRRRARRTRDDLAAELAVQGVDEAVLDQVLDQMVDSRLLRIEEIGENKEFQAYELAHDYLLDEIELDPVAQARKAARELLDQEVRTYQRHGTLLSAEKLSILEAQSEHLIPDADELNLLFRSARRRERSLHWWRDRALRFDLTGALADRWIESLLEEDETEADVAVHLLVSLSGPETVSRLRTLIEAQPPAGQKSPLYDSTLVQRRALAALAQMECSEAEDYLRELTPEGFCFVPAGEFELGSDERADEQPKHRVWLPAFWVSLSPVTGSDWQRFIDADGYTQDWYWVGSTAGEAGRRPVSAGWKLEPDKQDHPVRYLNWSEARAYAAWLAENSRLPVALPTEAEWEKAAAWDPTTAGARRYPWGDTPGGMPCNVQESGNGGTTPVGRHSPAGDSPCGARDMAGNVLEWTSSEYRAYPYRLDDGRESPYSDRPRVLRGGAFDRGIKDARCARRHPLAPAIFLSDTGCRVCLRLVPLTGGQNDGSSASVPTPG